MKKVIITGGTGFMGKNLLPFLKNLDAQFFLLGRSDLEFERFFNVQLIKCDIKNQKEVSKIMNQVKPSHLIHMAWSVSPSNLGLPENFELVKSSIHLLEQFIKNGGERFISIGSCFEYDWTYGLCKEDFTPTRSKSSYSACKNSFREYAEAFCKQQEIEMVWGRLFFLFGPHENPLRLIPHVIVSLLQNKPATIKNGGIFRDYMFAKRAAEYISKLLFHEFTGNLNICSGSPIMLGDIGKMIASSLNKPELLTVLYPEIESNKVLFGDSSKLESIFKTNSAGNLQEELEETINWWKFKIKTSNKVII